MPLRIHCLQHADHEGPANLARWAEHAGHALSIGRSDKGGRMQEVDAFDWLVVLGGAMSVHDVATYPWLAAEKRLVGEAVRAGKKVLGICLGAQLLAESLGAQVKKSAAAEIGWFPIRLTPEGKHHPWLRSTPPELPVFHWHEETFELPAGALRLAQSEACANQAFVVGNNLLGLQFHPELSAHDVARWLSDPAVTLPDGPFVQQPEAMRGAPYFAAMESWLEGLLDRFALS